jgi:hypothetical protein
MPGTWQLTDDARCLFDIKLGAPKWGKSSKNGSAGWWLAK